MRPQTAPLSRQIRGLNTPDEQLAVLAGRYHGETAYVFSCGPSMAEVWSDGLKEFLADKLVIAVKQTFALMPDIADFHLFNRCRHQDYVYPDPPPIRIAVELEPFRHQADIRLPFWVHDQQRWLHSVLFSRGLDRWALSQTGTRAWGPGIMLELGVFLPVHLGCARAVFFGWDMNPIEPTHYYDLTLPQEQLEEHVVVSNALPQFIPHLRQWFDAHGLDPYLCSPRSHIPLPQVPVAELPALHGSQPGG